MRGGSSIGLPVEQHEKTLKYGETETNRVGCSERAMSWTSTCCVRSKQVEEEHLCRAGHRPAVQLV